MIDRSARNKLAVLIRHLLACRITNDDLENNIPVSDDTAINAIHGAIWCLYSDLRTHKLDGERRIPKQGRREIARWISFLYSDEEYAWPRYSLFRIYNWPMNLITVGWWERKKEREFAQFKSAGDFEVWPFINRASFERAISNPVLLTGRRCR